MQIEASFVNIVAFKLELTKRRLVSPNRKEFFICPMSIQNVDSRILVDSLDISGEEI